MGKVAIYKNEGNLGYDAGSDIRSKPSKQICMEHLGRMSRIGVVAAWQDDTLGNDWPRSAVATTGCGWMFPRSD